MIPTYQFLQDAEFVKTMYRRFYRQQPLYRRPIAVNVLSVALIFAVASFSAPKMRPLLFAVVFISVTMWYMRRSQAMKIPPEEAQVELHESSIKACGEKSRYECSWEAVTKVCRFEDGFLVVRDKLFWWLPDSALHNAKVRDVEELFNSHKVAYRTVEQLLAPDRANRPRSG